MSRRSRRQVLAPGIYQDDLGIEVRAKIGKVPKSRRFPLGTSLKLLKDAQKVIWNELDAALKSPESQPTKDRSLLAAAIEHYILVSPTTKDSAELGAFHSWQAAFPELKRKDLTPGMCVAQFTTWGRTYSAQGLYYRRLVLKKLWAVLDGPKAPCPVDDLVVKRPKAKRPYWVDDATILRVYNQLLANYTPVADEDRAETYKTSWPSYRRRRKTSNTADAWDLRTPARFLVLALTGQRPAQLKRATPDQVQLWPEPIEDVHGVWWVPGAKGGEDTPIYLNAEMAEAWRRFHAANAWGAYDKNGFKRALYRAGWPKGVRPYNVRHAVGLTLSEGGIDLPDISGQLGHSDLSTTREFYVPQLHSRLKAISRKLSGRFPLPPLPGPKEA